MSLFFSCYSGTCRKDMILRTLCFSCQKRQVLQHWGYSCLLYFQIWRFQLYLFTFIYFFYAFLFYFLKLVLPLLLLSSKYRVALVLIKYPNCRKTFFLWNLSRYYKKFVCIQLEIARQPLLYKIYGNNAFYSLILSSNRQYIFCYF